MNRPDFGSLGRQYMKDESYGAAAFCFYREVLEHRDSVNAWNGLVLSLSLMRKEHETQSLLARHAFRETAPYDRTMISFALMLWQNNPRALSEWARLTAEKPGIDDEAKTNLRGLAEDAAASWAQLASEHGEEKLVKQGMISLSDFAARRLELDWIFDEEPVKVYEHAKQWTEDPEMALSGIRLLSVLPDPRSERLLRRACRNQAISPKARTHAALALRWMGVRGNVRLEKLGESFIVNLDEPNPELTVSVPEAYKPVLDRMKLLLAVLAGKVSAAEAEPYIASDEAISKEELDSLLGGLEIPVLYQEAVHVLIRAAYDHYYPLVPKIHGTKDWAEALLSLMQEYAQGIGEDWPYGHIELSPVALGHKKWLLSASPDFYEGIAGIRAAKQGQAAGANAAE